MKAVVTDLADIPEAVRGDYEERDGKYFLKLDGDLPGYVRAAELNDTKSKLAKFRDNYRNVMRQAAELAGVDELPEGDITPVKQALETYKLKLDELQQSSNGDDLQEKIQRAIKPLQEKVEAAEARERAATERANRALLRETFGAELTKAGARPNAVDFLLDRSEKDFAVKDDKVVAREDLLSEETGQPMSPEEWVKAAIKIFDFAFQESSGGGPPPPRAPGGSWNGSHPAGVKVLRNPTPEQLGEYAKEISQGKIKIV